MHAALARRGRFSRWMLRGIAAALVTLLLAALALLTFGNETPWLGWLFVYLLPAFWFAEVLRGWIPSLPRGGYAGGDIAVLVPAGLIWTFLLAYGALTVLHIARARRSPGKEPARSGDPRRASR